MEAAKVYFTDFHTTFRENQVQKLARLILTAGIDQIDFKLGGGIVLGLAQRRGADIFSEFLCKILPGFHLQ